MSDFPFKNMTETEYKILDAMEQYGGSFVKQLALLARLADGPNYEKLKTTFRMYFKRYEEDFVKE